IPAPDRLRCRSAASLPVRSRASAFFGRPFMDRLHRFALAAVAAACGSTLLIAASPSPAAPAAERNADPYTLPVDPVSGERLGKNAIVREYDGREVRFASERTAERFEADLKANLAALDERMIEDQAAFYP